MKNIFWGYRHLKKMVRVILFGWLGLIGKCQFHFPRVFPLVSDRSVMDNGKHPRKHKCSSLLAKDDISSLNCIINVIITLFLLAMFSGFQILKMLLNNKTSF